jgi:mono/diheme cytochrome c family protein
MRKLLSLGFVIFCVMMSCHKKAVPVITTRTEQPPPPPKAAEPIVANADVENGKTVYTTTCVRCHNAKPVANWTAEEWKPILRAMIPKAKLDSAKAAQVTAYVNAFARKAPGF